MGNLMDPFRGKGGGGNPPNRTVSVRSVGPIQQRDIRKPILQASRQDLSRAAAIYGAASSVFAVLTVFMFFKGMWVTGLIMIVPTFCLAGFSWYYMKP
jgi:hypothetical protein